MHAEPRLKHAALGRMHVELRLRAKACGDGVSA